MSIFGISIHPAPLMVEEKETRIRGGYLNRWWIRAVVTVPSSNVIHDRLNNRMYCHPAVIAQMRKAMQPDMQRAFA
ncbi:hypothetical protein [Rhodoferax ferrireducens]|uniref:hypothetical protein n=1 Tax=Rhodoferax ferrireducens TaxID=192843 RepID=UPI0013008BA8|nr:hypothetical protein [Rhodoferax ferrireducens]